MAKERERTRRVARTTNRGLAERLDGPQLDARRVDGGRLVRRRARRIVAAAVLLASRATGRRRDDVADRPTRFDCERRAGFFQCRRRMSAMRARQKGRKGEREK
jgi:hypothetical protein